MTDWTWTDAQVTRIVDGDTLDMRVTRDLGFGGSATFVVRLRLGRINAPKSYTDDGKAATAFLTSLIPVGSTASLTTTGPYKYGGPRTSPGEWMAEITTPTGNVSDLMVTAGHAVYWDGEGPRPADTTTRAGATVTYTLKIRRYDNADPRLGRHVLHDSRSLAYQVTAKDPATLTSVRHHTNIPTLDQGNLGSCTGNAATGALGSDELWGAGSGVLSTVDGAADEAYAVGVYSDATKLDPWPGTWPPTDTGSDGLSVAKVLKARGLISGYQHATSLNAALTALADGPVLIGSDWHNDMFNPDPDGRLHITGSIAGGHEYVLDELDVENQRVWMHNSWGESWGVQGRAYLTWADLGTLLGKDGDCTILVPITQPAPTPTPAPPPLPPGPVDPTGPVVPQALADALDRFTGTKSCPDYLRTAWVNAKEK